MIVFAGGCWVSAFTFLHFFVSPFARDANEANTVVSLVHAVAGTVWGAAVLLAAWTPVGAPLTAAQWHVMAFTLGYFTYDMVYVMLSRQWAYVAHHAAALLALGFGFLHGACGTELVGTLVCTELSSPFLHLRHLLRPQRSTPDGSRQYDRASRFFALSFLLSRCLVGGPLLSYGVWASDTTPIPVKCGGWFLHGLSMWWGWLIVRRALRETGGKAKVKPATMPKVH